MRDLRISLFGNVRVGFGDTPQKRLTRVVKGLLAYLVLYRERSHSREVLSNLFWGEYTEQSARSCLNTTLWRLRGILEPGRINKGTYLVSAADGDVAFNRDSKYWLDVEEFDTTVGRCMVPRVADLKPSQAKSLEKGLKLYVAELMEGCYDDWAVGERDRLRNKYLQGLERLMEYHDLRKSYEEAVTFGQQILYHDPLREDVHRDVMRLFAQSGQRTRAIRHFEKCCDLLDKELGVAPAGETRALYERILQLADGHVITASPESASSSTLEASTLNELTTSVRHAIDDCDAVRRRLSQLEDLLRKLGAPDSSANE
jgi:DNA-binding SARP family transcriptional activator